MTQLEEMIRQGRTSLYIGGEWRAAADGYEIDVLDPATGEPLTRVAAAGIEDALEAVTAASEAGPGWAATSPQERGEILRRAFELMVERADELAELIVLEMGKALSEARGEAVYSAEFLRWYSGEAVRNQGSILTAPAGDKRILAIHQPIGVSFLVTPWNFPAAMATRKIGPAIAAGCTMILKPASDTPLTALAMASLLEEAGLPAGVLNVIPARSSAEVVPAVLADPRVRKLSFTGSTEVGRELLKLAADRVINVSMELGGNAPFLVFDDAEIPDSVSGAMIAKLRNGGQSCIAANRIYAHEAVAGAFTDELSSAMAAIRTGPGLDPGVELGPMINEAAQKDLGELVGVSTGAGSTVATGGSAPDRPGFFFEPTVLAGVRSDDPILGHEIFGPVAPVVTFESEEEAIALANATHHGLAAYLYTGDLARALRVSEALEAGMVGVNRGLISDPAAPFGGVKESGIGREGGHEGMAEFLETKYIAADW
ncbi:MAG: NAD-dependent succinate-semialdehyde dehydrogenase [Acidimicrobiia bacterium]